MNFKWTKKTGQYQSGETLHIGSLITGVAHYEYNSTMSRNESEEYKKEHRYSGSTNLPGFTRIVYAPSPEEIKPKLEKVIDSWFAKVNS